MSWRFRKTFKVLPGVKLNLTRHGLSATLGAAPFSVNLGPRGVYRNVSIPGTGLWNRERVDIPSSHPPGIEPPTSGGTVPPPLPLAPPTPTPGIPPSAEIRSASTESLSSESMEQLRRLLKDAYEERAVLEKEIANAAGEVNTTKSRYENWERGFLMRRLRKQTLAARKEAFETAVAKMEELQEQLRQTTVATEITIDRQQAEPYYRMRDDFAALSGSQTIWNVLTEQAVDRIKERMTANTVISRDPVSFSLNSCDLIQWEQKVLHLPNRTGGDMYVYPGFILYRASRQAFALIDFRDVILTYVSTHFTEAGSIPSDSQIVGHTWARANKDGSPDRRFHDNYQIPVAHYGTLLFTSPDGLDVRYLCSHPALAERFVKGWSVFRRSLNNETTTETTSQSFPAEETPFNVAFGKFKAAHAKFTSTLITPTGKGTMLKDDFMVYMAAVVALIDAARAHVANSHFSRPAKAKFFTSIDTFETKKSDFEKAVGQRTMNTESFTTYTNALVAFLEGIRAALGQE